MIVITLLLIALAFAAELLILRKRIVVLSPTFMLLASLLAMYVLPYLFTSYTGNWTRLETLTSKEINTVLFRLNLFMVTYLIISVPLLRRLARRAARNSGRYEPLQYIPSKRAAYTVLVCYVAVFFLYIGSGVGFSPGEVLDRMIHPRDYTYIKSGFGPLIYLKTGLGFALVVMAASWWRIAPKKIGRNLVLFTAVILNVLGGSKSSLVMPFVAIVLVLQCTYAGEKQKLSKKIVYMLLAPMLAAVLVGTAFTLWGKQTEGSGLERVVTQLRDYGREAYLSARVIQDFPWREEYTLDAIEDTLTAPLPRVLFPEKEFVGFYKRYWMPMYESNVVQYHTTTSGFVAEGHMAFGAFSPVIYAILFALLIVKLYERLLMPRSMRSLGIAIFITSQMYFIARTGFFGTTLWFILIPSLVIWLTYYLTRRRTKRSYSRRLVTRVPVSAQGPAL